MARSSQKDAAENRARVVAAASSMMRQKGVDGVHIDELMAEAGLTRGGFYKMFGSKDHLHAEACATAFAGAARTWTSILKETAGDRLRRLVKFYFEPKEAGVQCPMATLAVDAARAEPGGQFRQAFTAGLQDLVGVALGENPTDRELGVFAAMVGALVLKRASDDTGLSGKIEMAVLDMASSDRQSASIQSPG